MEQLTYFILTRKIFESSIWCDDPHILKLFIFLIGNARHSKTPKKYNGFEIKRGELVTSLSLLSDNNEYIKNGRLQNWSRSKVSRMLKVLEDQKYIKILSDTYGTHISVCNYDTYQKPDTYKTNTSETAMKRNCNDTETELDINNNDNNVNNDNNEKKSNLPEKAPAFNLQSELRNIFESHYFKLKKTAYYYDGKSAGALKQLINKIRSICAADKKTDQDVINGFKYILNSLNDEWVKDNLDIPLINSKFNSIISKIKNGQNTNSNGTSGKGFDLRKNSWIESTLKNALLITGKNSD